MTTFKILIVLLGAVVGIIVGVFALGHLAKISDTEIGVIVIVLALIVSVWFICDYVGTTATQVQNALLTRSTRI